MYIYAFICRGSWDTFGVEISNRTNQLIECVSSHLTSFAVLIDVNGAYEVTTYMCVAICT